MNLALSCQLVRQLDGDAIQKIGLSGLLLMENAARGAAEHVRSRGPWKSVTIVAGPGNNGGDGLAMARLLAAQCIDAEVLLVTGDKKLSADAQANLMFLERSGLSVNHVSAAEISEQFRSLTETDLIVDALLGTGIRGIVQSPFSEVIEAINLSEATVLAVDVPSGLDCDTGLPCGVAVQARFTVTFAAMKQGFLTPAAEDFTGSVEVCSIGIPARWIKAWYERVHGSSNHQS